MRVVVFFLLFASCYYSCRGQIMDTITVTTDKTVYVLFESEVTLVDLGTEEYVHQIVQNIVMLKAAKANAKLTSLLIKTGSDIFIWIIQYRRELPTLRIDTRVARLDNEKGKEQVPANIKQESASPIVTQPPLNDKYTSVEMPSFIEKRSEAGNRDVNVKDKWMQGKIYSILSDKKNYRDLGEISNSIYFSLHDLRVDKQYLYIKMGLFNTSSIAFDLDVVYFERNQGRSLKKREAHSNSAISSSFHESVLTVLPAAEEVIVFVLDLFAYNDKDKLMVKINERGGVRSLQFHIPAKEIVNAKSL